MKFLVIKERRKTLSFSYGNWFCPIRLGCRLM